MTSHLTPSRNRVMFISSANRSSGDLNRFCVDVSPLIMDMTASRDEVHLELSVGMLYVPFEAGSQGFVSRIPAIEPIPQVKLVRLHTDLVHHNISDGGHSGMLLQIPFTEHYKEAPASTNGQPTFSHVTYEEQNKQSSFSLIHGLHGVSCITFWITDELDRPLVPADDWYISLVLTYNHNTELENKFFQHQVLQALRSLDQSNRLLLFQGDSSNLLPRNGPGAAAAATADPPQREEDLAPDADLR